MKYVHGIA
jgi:hypothetical protein